MPCVNISSKIRITEKMVVKVVVVNPGPRGPQGTVLINIDGGSPSSVYTVNQRIEGGSP
jgi:hypothetical protein